MSDRQFPTSEAPSSRRLVDRSSTVPSYQWDKEPEIDDALHDPRAKLDPRFTLFSLRGWLNGLTLLILALGILMLFIGYPLYDAFGHHVTRISGYNLVRLPPFVATRSYPFAGWD